jgi:signal transduction histidine kinase
MPIHDAAGQIVRWFGTNTDITELRSAQASLMDSEERLRSLAGRLEHLVEERTEELVQSQAELRALAREVNLAEQRERKRLAVELHDHLAQMLVLTKLKLSQMKNASLAPGCLGLVNETDTVLTQCLSYTRTLVANLAPPVLHDFGLPAALKWLGEQLSQQDLRVTVRIGLDDLPLPEEQAVLLFQSVRELLMNVVKHAASGDAVVTLDQRDEELRIHVRDDGIGFDPSADGLPVNAMSSKFGLFSIRERMRAMGGALEVESEKGKGTTATLRVPLPAPGAERTARGRHDHSLTRSRSAWPVAHVSPLDTVSREASAVSFPRDTPPVPPALGAASIRVLLVDDHAMVRQGLRSVLESYPDLEVVGEAWDGEEAVSSVERFRPAIVVMDINMPKMNGIEATAVIKARYPATIIVGLSVNAEGENQRAMLQAGAAMLLTKEAAVEELHAAILKVLDRQ